jgi:hypothetical protein
VNKARTFFFAVLLLGLPAFAGAQTLTEKSVKDLMLKIDKAIASKDVSVFAQTMSENAEVVITVSAGGNQQKTRMNKAEYLAALRGGWSMASTYVYRRSNEKIAISGNIATVTADVVENMSVNGQHIRARTRSTATIELVDGAPKVTKVVGNTSM